MKISTRSTMLTGLLALGITAFIPGTVLAEEMAQAKPEANLAMGIYSQYVWRGFALSDSSVVLQPAMTVSYKGFGVNLWGNLDSDYLNSDEKNWSETDMTISYDGTAGKIGYGVGWIYYEVDGDDDAQEFYVSASADTMLAPTLTVYADLEGSSAWYSTLGVSHSIPVAEGLGLDLGAQIGYLDNGDTYHEFHDGQISAAMTFAINDYVSVTPELYYSFALTSDAKNAIATGSADLDDSHIYGGISASLAF